MLNILTFDIEDYFQVDNFSGIIKFSDWDKYEGRVEENTEKILELLSVSDTKATFFVLGWTAEKYPGLIKKIHSAGHEIASHSYGHRLVFRQTRQDFRQDLKKAKGILENIIQDEVIGYRAPTFSVNDDSRWAFDILAEEGFKYDSSFSPARFRFSSPANSFSPYKIDTPEGMLWEFPVFSGGGYFRLLPYWLIKRKTGGINKKGCPAVIYLHPWEFDLRQPKIRTDCLKSFRHYVNIHTTEAKLKEIVCDYKFTTVMDFIARGGK